MRERERVCIYPLPPFFRVEAARGPPLQRRVPTSKESRIPPTPIQERTPPYKRIGQHDRFVSSSDATFSPEVTGPDAIVWKCRSLFVEMWKRCFWNERFGPWTRKACSALVGVGPFEGESRVAGQRVLTSPNPTNPAPPGWWRQDREWSLLPFFPSVAAKSCKLKRMDNFLSLCEKSTSGKASFATQRKR